LFRMERDRQGVIRLFPGSIMQGAEGMPAAAASPASNAPRTPRPWQPGDDIPDIHEADRDDPPAPAAQSEWSPSTAASEVVEGDVVQEMETPSVIDAEPEPQVEEDVAAPKKGRGRATRGKGSSAAKAPREAKAPRAKKAAGAARARAPRAKKPAE